MGLRRFVTATACCPFKNGDVGPADDFLASPPPEIDETEADKLVLLLETKIY